MDQVIHIIVIIGVFAFAISGALTAMTKKFDAFGVFIIAFVTAVGGGSLRDVIIVHDSVFWLTEPVYTYMIIAGTVFAILFKKKMGYLRKTLFLFDTIGLALFTIFGIEVGIQNEFSAVSCIALGTITGSFGGVIRDILVNDVPLIFKKEIYATISIAGGIVYFILEYANAHDLVVRFVPIFLILALRLVVVYFGISLPSIYKEDRIKKKKK